MSKSYFTFLQVVMAIVYGFMIWLGTDLLKMAYIPDVSTGQTVMVGGVIGEHFTLTTESPIAVSAASNEGEFYLLDDNGNKYLESHLFANRVQIAEGTLPSGHYTVSGSAASFTLEASEGSSLTTVSEPPTRVKILYTVMFLIMVALVIWYVRMVRGQYQRLFSKE